MPAGLGTGMWIASSSFLPSDVTSASGRTWYRADTGITLVSGLVSTWAELFYGIRTLLQSTASRRPGWTSAHASYNNRAVVDWTGTASNSVLSTSSTSALTQPHTHIIVGQPGNTTVQRVATQMATGSNMFIGALLTSGRHFVNAGTALQTTIQWSSPSVVFVEINGPSSKIFINNHVAPVVTGNAGSTNLGGNLHVGSSGGASNNWGGPIAEYIAYNGVLSDDDRENVMLYARTRYGI